MKEEWRGNGSWEGGQMSVPWGGKVAADCGRREEGRKQDGWVRIQMTTASITVGKNPLEEMERPS